MIPAITLSFNQHGKAISLKKFEKWQRIDDGGAFRYPLADTQAPELLRPLVGADRGARDLLLQEHFPELWCWLQFNIDHSNWTLGFRYHGPQVWSFYLLLVLKEAPLFEVAWEDHIE